MHAPSSTIHTVVTGLVSVMQRVLDPTEVPVYDGFPSGEFPRTRGLIVVGVAPGDTVPIVAQESPMGLGDRADEDITVRSWLSVQDPAAPDFTLLRSSAIGVLSQIDEALRADPTLGGACDYCSLSGRVGIYPARTTEAAVIDVMFEIDAKAYL